MDWNLFWTAFGAIGGTLGAVATTAAVVVALWQTKYSQKKIIKLGFSDNFQLYNPNTGESVKFIGISVTNTGNRKVIIRTWGVHLKEGSAIVMPPVDANGIEKMVYTKLPQTVKETIGVGVNEKAALSSDKNCPFVYLNFDFTLVNKVASL